MKFFRLLAFMLLASAPSFAETGFLDRNISFKGETFAYQIYVPREYTPSQSWPVIVYLHGNGGQGSDGIFPTEGAAGIGHNIRQDRAKFPAIVVFPQAKVGTRWLHPEMQELVIAQLDHAVAEFHGDAKRLYLVGFSMGAVGSYRIAYRWPERFAAIVAVAGRVETSIAEPEIDRKSNPFVIAADPFAALAERIKKIPIWVFHSDGDTNTTTPVEQSRRFVSALKKVAPGARYTEYSGLDHIPSALKAFAEGEMIQWLFTQHK